MSDEVSLYEAKAKLSALVRRVREGRTVVITVHGEPAAELRPIDKSARKQTLSERLDDLELRGLVTSSSPRSAGDPLALRTVGRRPGALKRFLEERD